MASIPKHHILRVVNDPNQKLPEPGTREFEEQTIAAWEKVWPELVATVKGKIKKEHHPAVAEGKTRGQVK